MALVLRNNLLYAHPNITSERCCSLELDLLQLQHGIKHSDAKKQIHAFNALIKVRIFFWVERFVKWTPKLKVDLGSFHYKQMSNLRKNIFACLFSVHNTISLPRHEQVCLMRLRFKRYFSHHQAYYLTSWEKYLSKRSLIKHTCS